VQGLQHRRRAHAPLVPLEPPARPDERVQQITHNLLLALGVHAWPLPAAESNSPNAKLNIAAIGTGNRARGDIEGVAGENIVALCDVDEQFLEKAAQSFPRAKRYSDFRILLDKEAKNIDAVVVGTPDHTHAPASAAALRLGKHVYCEKPLTHTVYEARKLAELAQENKCVTQMGTQIHAGENYRQVVELIQAGAIGKVSEVHVWVTAQYSGGRFTTGAQAPSHVNWDLWLGPAKERPYSEGIHPFNWRRFWDYGTGALGDFGCHYMDLPHWALDLRRPTRCRAEGPPVDEVSTPEWCIAYFDYPARGEAPSVKLTWYDSGKQPRILATLRRKDGKPLADQFRSGQLFIGEKGMLISDYGKHVLLPEEKFEGYQRPEATLPRSIGHHREWIEACKTGGPTTCNFDYSGALTEAVLLGVVAYRCGQEFEWDAENLKAKNAPEADRFIHKEYRKGWML
jgi:predicted dehydrogenase